MAGGFGDALFMVPTICDSIPAAQQMESRDGRLFRIHEDDWRQVEFIAASLRSAVQRELATITEIRKEASGLPGFRRVHVRSALSAPLAGSRIPMRALTAPFEPTEARYEGVGYDGRDGAIPGGFAFEAGDGVALYGVARASAIDLVGIHIGSTGVTERTADAIAAVLEELSLMVVDWCRAGFSLSGPDSIRELLS